MAIKYSQLEDRKGTIYNKETRKGYGKPADLARDLGIEPHKIDWSQIKPPEVKSSSLFEPFKKLAAPLTKPFTNLFKKSTPAPTPTPAPTSAPTSKITMATKQDVKNIYTSYIGREPTADEYTHHIDKTGYDHLNEWAMKQKFEGVKKEQPLQPQIEKKSTPSSDPSIVNFLNSLGLPSDYNSRSRLAREHGITGYMGTGPQNTRLLEMLRQEQEGEPTPGQKEEVETKDLPDDQDQSSEQDTQSEIEQINTEENQSQEEELDIIETESSEDVDLSTSASLVERLLKTLETKKTEDTPSMEQKFIDERKALGIGELETSFADIESEMKQLDADYMSAIEGEEGRKVSMTQVKRRQSAEGIQYNRAKRDLQVERDSIANQLNMKYGVLNSIVKYAGVDYDNAQQDYQLKWNTAMQMTNLVKGMEDSAKTDEERKTDNARANAQIMFNLFKEGNISYGSLDEATKLDIKNMEIQAGLPIGFTGFIMETIDDPIVHFGSEFTNAAGDRMQPITMVDKETGNITVKNVNLGQAGVGSDGKGPSSYQEWTLAGGLEGTGKSYADFIATRTGDTEAEKIQKARVGIATYLNQNTGDDGFVSPDTFKKARNAWVSDGYSSEDFDKAYKNFANPSHYREYSPEYY